MAQNPLPKPTGALLILAGKCTAGLTTYATPLGITQITPASLAADAAALSTAMGDFNATRANRTAAHASLQAASAAAKTFLSHGRSVLAALGQRLRQNWASAGWTNNSTAVPNVHAGPPRARWHARRVSSRQRLVPGQRAAHRVHRRAGDGVGAAL